MLDYHVYLDCDQDKNVYSLRFNDRMLREALKTFSEEFLWGCVVDAVEGIGAKLVKDSGKVSVVLERGISPEEAKQIYQKFYRFANEGAVKI